MSELAKGDFGSVDVPPGIDQVAVFSGRFAVVTARQREWDATVQFLKNLKGDNIVERSAIELQDGTQEYGGGAVVAVNAGNVNEARRVVSTIPALQGGNLKDVTVLVRVDDTDRQKKILEDEQWPRFDLGRLPDRPQE